MTENVINSKPKMVKKMMAMMHMIIEGYWLDNEVMYNFNLLLLIGLWRQPSEGTSLYKNRFQITWTSWQTTKNHD